jgi:phenylpropionate dioxygenase-like ring-hydroxylating dioxygenase large terminal subunit
MTSVWTLIRSWNARKRSRRATTDPAMLSLEKERIFRRTWQLVGRLSQSI